MDRTIRSVHHLACSGGSLVSKCIAALPKVFLLSEVHPYSRFHFDINSPEYSPSDIIRLSQYANFPDQRRFAAKIFRANIEIAQNHIASRGGYLVIRDHSHADFFVDDHKCKEPVVRKLLNDDWDLLSLVTIRNPVDSFISLVKNNWLHFQPVHFDEYCRRVLLFLKAYPEVSVIKYEDFVIDPLNTMADICLRLSLPFSKKFIDTFDTFRVTGNSGRRGNIIALRERKEIPDTLVQEIRRSRNFKSICNLHGYNFE